MSARPYTLAEQIDALGERCYDRLPNAIEPSQVQEIMLYSNQHALFWNLPH